MQFNYITVSVRYVFHFTLRAKILEFIECMLLRTLAYFVSTFFSTSKAKPGLLK